MKSLAFLLTAMLAVSLGCESGTTMAEGPAPPPDKQPVAAATRDLVRLSPEAILATGLEVVAVEERELPVEMTVSGRVEHNEDRTVRVKSYVSGIVMECCKSVGDWVAERETLTVLHTHQTHDLLGEYRQAIAEYEATQSELELARETFQRESRLLELKVGSVAKTRQAETAMKRAESAVEAADAAIEATIAHLDYLVEEIPEEIRNRQSGPVPDFDISVKTPIAGTVISRTITPGSVVDPTDDLYEISDLSRLWVIAQIPEELLSELALGMAAEVEVRAYPGRAFRGRVARIASELDPETRTVQVRCEVANPGGALKTGMYAKVVLRSSQSRSAVVVPESAIQHLEEEAFVFRPAADGTFQRQAVTVGLSVDSFAEVTGGLSAGDQVVAHGSFLLKAEMLKSELAGE